MSHEARSHDVFDAGCCLDDRCRTLLGAGVVNLAAIAAAISAALAGAGGFAAAWNIQAKIISDTKLEHSNAIIVQQRYARAALERATGQVITAQNAASARTERNRVDADRAGNAGNGLRSTSTDAVRASSSDLDACTAAISAHSVVLSAVSREAERLAEIADTWASQALILQDAWPKENFTKQALVK